MAEWSKAVASGATPQGRGFEPHSCQSRLVESSCAATAKGRRDFVPAIGRSQGSWEKEKVKS